MHRSQNSPTVRIQIYCIMLKILLITFSSENIFVAELKQFNIKHAFGNVFFACKPREAAGTYGRRDNFKVMASAQELVRKD